MQANELNIVEFEFGLFILTSLIKRFFFRILVIASLREQRNASFGGVDSNVGESSPLEWAITKDNKSEENFDVHALSIGQASSDDDSHLGLTPVFRHDEFRIEGGFEVASVVEHQFISTRFSYGSPVNDDHHQEERESQENLCALRNESEEEEISVSLQLGEPECKRRKVECDSMLGFNDSS